MTNPTNPTIPALLQPHLKAFLPLLNKETLIDVVLGMNLELTNAKQELDALKQELDARTAEFEEKYYGLDLLNRALEKCNTFHVERTAELTKRLAQAEAALGVPAYDEWDVWSDAANRNA